MFVLPSVLDRRIPAWPCPGNERRGSRRAAAIGSQPNCRSNARIIFPKKRSPCRIKRRATTDHCRWTPSKLALSIIRLLVSIVSMLVTVSDRVLIRHADGLSNSGRYFDYFYFSFFREDSRSFEKILSTSFRG